jgi:hypothetical protein
MVGALATLADSAQQRDIVLVVVAMAVGTAVRVCIPAREQRAQPAVQQHVVRVVLARDEIRVCVVLLVLVDVVNGVFLAEVVPERALDNEDVLGDVPLARARMAGLRRHDVAVGIKPPTALPVGSPFAALCASLVTANESERPTDNVPPFRPVLRG